MAGCGCDCLSPRCRPSRRRRKPGGAGTAPHPKKKLSSSDSDPDPSGSDGNGSSSPLLSPTQSGGGGSSRSESESLPKIPIMAVDQAESAGTMSETGSNARGSGCALMMILRAIGAFTNAKDSLRSVTCQAVGLLRTIVGDSLNVANVGMSPCRMRCKLR